MDLSPEDDFPGRLLHQAALWDNVELLEDLLRGAQSTMLDCQDSWGRAPIHAAAITAESKCLRILLKAGANPNSRCGSRGDNRTALHMSVDRGHHDNARCLLEFGACLSTRDSTGMTALDIADRAGNTRCMTLLKEAADARDQSRHELHTALRAAVTSGDELTVRNILQELESEAEIIVNMAPGGANTLLFTACQLGLQSIATLLLEHGADGRAHPVTKYSPLYSACHHGNTQVTETLLKKFPQLVQHTTMERWLPIHAGCINGHVAVVALLLRYCYPEHLLSVYRDPSGRWEWRLPFDPNAQDVTGQSPLYVVCLLGNKQLVELLLGWRVKASRVQGTLEDISSTSTTPTATPSPMSPTRRRISDGIQSIMSRLSLGRDQVQENPQETLISPLSLDLYCNNGRETALLAAVRGGHHEVAAALLAAGADPNLPARGPQHAGDHAENVEHVEDSPSLGPVTPLVEAARQRALPLVELMLRHGSRDDHCHALSVAAANQDEPIVARLLAIKAYPDQEYKINKKVLGKTVETDSNFTALSSITNLTYSALFPNTPTMINWHNQKCQLNNIRPQWLSAAALHCNPRLKTHPRGVELCLTALTRIDVSNNSLTSITPEVFQLGSLRYLNVAQNKIERLPLPNDKSSNSVKKKVFRKQNVKTDYGCPVLEELYLQDNRLENIPDAVFRIPSLVTLDVSNNKLQTIPYTMWKAPALRELNVAFNMLRELPTQEEMFNKDFDSDSISVSSSDSRLSISDISECDSIDGSKSKRKHPAVCQLELKRHHVWSRSLEITEQILHREDAVSETSSQLSALNLAHNAFTSIPVALPCLAVNLTRLNLSYNSLRSMSHVTSYPASLKQLDLSHNMVSCWPSLPQVEASDPMEMAHLACYCPIEGTSVKPKPPVQGARNSRSLRSCILQSVCTHRRHLRLESLRTLILADNLLPRIQLATDEEGGVACDDEDSDWNIVNAAKARLVFPNLSMLDISNNCLKDIPSSIHELSNLSVLNVSGNTDISELPPHMGLLSRLWNLNTRGCSLQEPLRSMIDSKKYKTMDIIGYLKSVLEDAKPYARMKLMIVGVQGIGKTSLLDQLRQEGVPHYRKKPVEHWAKRMGHKNINVKTHKGTNMSTVGVDIGDWVFEKKVRGQSTHGPVIFRTWDFGGQKEYYATHQYFLSRRSLYLVVWRIIDGKQGLIEILQWLVNIQARAPNSPVIIVGTHYDAVGESCPASISEELQQLIRERFINIVDAEKLGLPRVLDTIEVSCRTRHNVRLLCGIIYDTVFSLRPPGSKELLLEQRVPASYLALEDVIGSVAATLRAQGSDPVLSAEQYRSLVAQEMSSKFHRAFRDWAELNQATMFLHDNGVLLHYDDATLKDLYFLDPQWLCDVLAHVVTIREINPFARTGVMRLDDLKHVFKSSSLGPPDGRGYIVSLLNKFEVALTWDSRTLLIPSLLPPDEEHKPTQAVTVKIPLRSRGWAVRGKKLSSTDAPFSLSAPQIPSSSKKEPCTPVYELSHRRQPNRSVTRLLLMSYFPSGFWSRLITRVLADDAIVDIVRGFFPIPNAASEDPLLARLLDVKAEWSLWQTGLRLRYGDITVFRMREVLPLTRAPYRHLRFRLKQEGVWCDVDLAGSSILEIHFPVHDMIVRRPDPTDSNRMQDVVIEPCMKSTAQLLALAVDHIDILLEDWYPTLGTRFVHTSEGRFLVTRLVPCPLCLLNATSSNGQSNPNNGTSEPSVPPELPEKFEKAFQEPLLDYRARKSQDSLGWSDGDSGVGHSGGSSRVPSVEGHPVVTSTDHSKSPHFSWMVEECILAAYDKRKVNCPTHGDVALDSIAPDTIFMDLSEKHIIHPEDISRGPLLGRGAFGFVFRASCKARGSKQIIDVAMKMLQPVQPGSRARQSAVIAYKAAQGKWERDPLQYACKAYCTARQELNILLALRHPNIVPLVGVCTQPLALVLDLAPQGALDAALRHYRRSGARVGPYCLQSLVLQAARAIEYLHRQRIIYRDLKAENVLVWQLPPPFSDHPDNLVHIKVADYGISRLTLPSGAKGFGGTEGFMAPEIMRYNGEEEYTEKVDCFSFGMFLYELITLRQPFEGHEAVKECILEGGRPPLTYREVQFPSYCLDLMVLCWAQQPKDRPSASQIVSIASAPEFTHLLDVSSLNHNAHVHGAAASPVAYFHDESQIGWEVWMLCGNCRIDVLFGTNKGWQMYHTLNSTATLLPPGPGGTVNQAMTRPTVACCVGQTVWVGDSQGRIQAYLAGDCSPLFSYALETEPLSYTPVACLMPLPSMKRVACALGNGRLFLLDSEAHPSSPTAGEGSFVLTELGSGKVLHSLAPVFKDDGACELWCGESGGVIGIFTMMENIVSGHESMTHFTNIPSAASLAVTELVSSGNSVWSYVYPGCVVFQWNATTRVIEHRLDCSKLVPCSESLKSIAIEEHLSPGRCQVTSLCVLDQNVYIGTTWGCIIIAERDSLRPVTIFRPYEEEVRSIIPLYLPNNSENSAEESTPYIVTIGRGYRSLIGRYTDQAAPVLNSPASTPRGSDESRSTNTHALLWRAEHWAAA